MEKLSKASVEYFAKKYGIEESDIGAVIFESDKFVSLNFQADEYLYQYESYYDADGLMKSDLIREACIGGGQPKTDPSNEGQSSPSSRGVVDLFKDKPNPPKERVAFNPLESSSTPSKRADSKPDDTPNGRVEQNQFVFKDIPSGRVNDNPSDRVKQLELEIIELKKEIKRLSKFEEKMKSRRTITEEQINLIKNLLRQGKKTQAEIVEISGTSNGTVWRVKNGHYDA